LSLSRKLGFIALLYVIEGFPMGVYQEIWPVYFRAHGVSLTEIGLYSGLYFAWSLKVFWSPLVDRFGEKRQWIAAAMATMASSLVALSWLPAGSTPLVWLAMATFCVASATQDIAIDAYTIGLVERGQEGPANSVRVAAYRVGFLLAGGGLLLLPSAIGWDGTFAMGAVLSGVLAASAFLCPRVDNPGRQERDANLWARWRDREGVLPVIAFVLLYRVGDRAMGAMVKPFWVDRGFSFEEIALYSTSFGIGATILGAVVGGVVVSRIGIYRSLWWLGGAAIASNLSYAAAAIPSSPDIAVIAASVVESFCGGLASAAFLSFLMRICDRRHAAVEYAMLTALYAAAGTLISLPSGVIAEWLGYAGYFALTAAFALPGLAFLSASRSWASSD
jgi:PAT family beta-lactamase induction signal transducer AmpG